MILPNMHYANLKDSYLFYNIAQKTGAYLEANPGTYLYRMGIGDVSLPLPEVVIQALHQAVDDQATKEHFHGYMPECGAPFFAGGHCRALQGAGRTAVCRRDFRVQRGQRRAGRHSGFV